MSSMFSRASKVVERESRKRSTSETRMNKVKERRRVPAIDVEEEKDVSTLVCLEISRAILLNPEVNMGPFLKTSSDSRRDLSISDATLIISTAILDHIGNKKMAEKILSKSSTITNYYSKMGLDNDVTRSMFVTLLFALNPGFVEMVERSLRLVIDRSSALAPVSSSVDQVNKALGKLDLEGSISRKECIEATTVETMLDLEMPSLKRDNSIQITPTDMIAPSDSISVVAKPRKRRVSVNEHDLLNFIGRRKQGIEPDFKDVFIRSRPPVSLATQNNRKGIYEKKNEPSPNYVAQRMNEILGSATVASYNMKTGNVTARRPRVDDYLESASIAESALYSPPDVEQSFSHNYENVTASKPVFTESVLLDSESTTETIFPGSLKTMTSFEELMASLGN